MKKQRPVHLNLFYIKLPLSAIVSILHRLSGTLLFLLLPVLLWGFQLSLQSEGTFKTILNTVKYNLFVKLFIIAVLWAFIYHFMAGIRFLLLDMHLGIELRHSRMTAKLTLVMSVAASLIIAGLIW